MILSKGAKYAIRAVLHLAGQRGAPLLSRQIARDLEIPAQYLAKVLQDLARSGVLRSAKGRGGGFRLARSPAEIDLLQVVQAIEGERFGEGCVLGLPECGEENPCPLHAQWGQVRVGILSLLERTRLADLPNDEIGPLLT